MFVEHPQDMFPVLSQYYSHSYTTLHYTSIQAPRPRPPPLRFIRSFIRSFVHSFIHYTVVIVVRPRGSGPACVRTYVPLSHNFCCILLACSGSWVRTQRPRLRPERLRRVVIVLHHTTPHHTTEEEEEKKRKEGGGGCRLRARLYLSTWRPRTA